MRILRLVPAFLHDSCAALANTAHGAAIICGTTEHRMGSLLKASAKRWAQTAACGFVDFGGVHQRFCICCAMLVSSSDLAAGLGVSGALGADGSLWLWGFGETCQLGRPTEDDAPTPVHIPAAGRLAGHKVCLLIVEVCCHF